ncbi:MAG: 30S ribosomal protein S1 [Terriglobia bacterium]
MLLEDNNTVLAAPEAGHQTPAQPDNHRQSSDAKLSESAGVSQPATEEAGAAPAVAAASTEEAAANADMKMFEAAMESGDTNLFATMDQLPTITPGQLLRCEVLKVTESEVVVDVGLKSEAAMPLAEFMKDGKVGVARGDTVDLLVELYDEEEGTVKLSYQKAAVLRAWDDIERAFQEQKPMRGRVKERIKGGLAVDVGAVAFLPASQVDTRPFRDLDSLLGQEIECLVVKVNRKRNNVVVSRKAVLEEEANRQRALLVEKLVEGAELVGRVKNLTEYGAFVDLGGMDGLLHVTDLSWGRANHPSDVVHVGQELTVKVLKYVPDKGRVSLGLKQLSPDPWDHAPSTYRVGDRIFGRVVSLTDYGAFVELEPGVEGLIHISEMTWSKRLKHPSKVLNVGDRVEVAVLEVNSAQRRISLSLRQTLEDPWSTLAQRLPVGSKVQGRVRNLTDFGAFVEIEEGVDGLIHLTDVTWSKRIKDPAEVLKKGQKIEAQVLALDPINRRLSLGLKQLQPDIWETFFSRAQKDDVARGTVLRMASFGAFVELAEGVEGLCHVSEMGAERGRLKVGRDYNFRILRLNAEEKRIGLSMIDVEQTRTPEPQAKAPEPVVAPEPEVKAAEPVVAPEPEVKAAEPVVAPEPEASPELAAETADEAKPAAAVPESGLEGSAQGGATVAPEPARAEVETHAEAAASTVEVPAVASEAKPVSANSAETPAPVE